MIHAFAAARKRWLLLSVFGNLGILGFFKYYNFFATSAADLFAALGMPLGDTTLRIVLPVGISFYTFQTLSYSIDVYRRKIPATRNLLDLALFVGFFPQLVAGPIVRAADFLPQLRGPKVFARVEARTCLLLFLVGFFKKCGVSDNLAPPVDAYYAAPQQFSALSAWIATTFFAIQIYCDFSGYSDMAIACAGLLGYRLCDNFNYPYLARNMTDFWHRWHISLSTWLRDYLYIPLGGSRLGTFCTYRNIIITMLLGGLWHGAAWTFVVWGALHGTALVVHKAWRPQPQDIASASPVDVLAGRIVTIYWILFAWIFFRSPDLETAWTVVRSFVFLQSPSTTHLGLELVWCVPILLAIHWIGYRKLLSNKTDRLSDWAFAGFYGVASSLAIALAPAGHRTFIYFQF